MAIINCKECGGKVSENANACPHCGNTDLLSPEEQLRRAIHEEVFRMATCPACGSIASPINRGQAFGKGNLLGAFTKSMQCNLCGHLF